VTYFDDADNPQIIAMVDAQHRRGFLEFSLAGLGLFTALAAGLGWAVSGRVLPAPHQPQTTAPPQTWQPDHSH
jgi:hypothetical protein